MRLLFTMLGIMFTVLLVLSIIHKDDDVDLSYLEDR